MIGIESPECLFRFTVQEHCEVYSWMVWDVPCSYFTVLHSMSIWSKHKKWSILEWDIWAEEKKVNSFLQGYWSRQTSIKPISFIIFLICLASRLICLMEDESNWGWSCTFQSPPQINVPAVSLAMIVNIFLINALSSPGGLYTLTNVTSFWSVVPFTRLYHPSLSVISESNWKLTLFRINVTTPRLHPLLY